MEIFNFQDLTGEFTVMDVLLAMVLSSLLSAFIGWIYKRTHRGTSYSQSFVITLVMNGMVVALVMMIVGSNIARAFSLVGALSIIRFRNAVKETGLQKMAVVNYYEYKCQITCLLKVSSTTFFSNSPALQN